MFWVFGLLSCFLSLSLCVLPVRWFAITHLCRLPSFYSSADVGAHNFRLLTSILRNPHDRQTRSLIITAHLQYPSMPQPLSASLRSIDLTLDWGFVLSMVITEASQHTQRRKTRREWGNQRLLSDFMVDWERHVTSAFCRSQFVRVYNFWVTSASTLAP